MLKQATAVDFVAHRILVKKKFQFIIIMPAIFYSRRIFMAQSLFLSNTELNNPHLPNVRLILLLRKK